MLTSTTTSTTNKSINNEQFFVQSQPLIQYGPLSFTQLKELYVNEVIDDKSFVASLSAIQKSKNNNNSNKNKKTRKNNDSPDNIGSFHIIPNETQLWTPIRTMDTVYSELEDAIQSFSKNRPNKFEISHQRNSNMESKDNNSDENGKKKRQQQQQQSPSNVNFQVNMNVNGQNVPRMDINMNISSNDKNNEINNNNNITRRQIEALNFKLSLLEQKNKNLSNLNKDLQSQINSLKAKYQSQFVDLKAKMLKQLEEYKKKRQLSQSSLQSEVNRLRNMNRNSLKNNVEIKHIIKENEQLSVDNDQLKKKQNKLIDEISQLQLNILYYKTRYKALQSKYDLETFNYDKYHSNISDLKEQIIHKQSIIDYSSQIVSSLLKNTICDLIPYQASLNEIEGNHNLLTNDRFSITRNIIRLDALKVSELLSWHNYSTKFHLAMEMLTEYELTSRRSRSRMKNVVGLLGEKVKSLNIHNLTPSELIALSRDLKQSYESISSEQHLKEYELSNQRREFMKHTPIAPKTPATLASPLAPAISRGISLGAYLGDDNDDDDNYGISFGSMASLSMMDIQPGNFSRNQSLHSLSPSLDGTESIIAKHRKKSGTIKGSGLKLLTDESTLSQYLDPQKVEKDNKERHDRQKSLSTSLHHRGASNRSISRSQSHRVGKSNRNSPLGTKPGKFVQYSAFTNSRAKKSTSTRGMRHHKHSSRGGNGHYKHSSISSNKSLSRSQYGLYTQNNNNIITRGNHFKNDSMTSISALSGVGDNESRLQLTDLNESYEDDDEDSSTVILKASPKKDKKITFDTDGQSGIPMFNPSAGIDENNEKDDKALSNDILSFFAM